jgi:hypothetical protein
MTSSTSSCNFDDVIFRVREKSAPVKTTPVGWSSKTVDLINLLKQNNPYTTIPDHIKTQLDSVRKMPELCDYLPWIVCGPRYKELPAPVKNMENTNAYYAFQES